MLQMPAAGCHKNPKNWSDSNPNPQNLHKKEKKVKKNFVAQAGLELGNPGLQKQGPTIEPRSQLIECETLFQNNSH